MKVGTTHNLITPKLKDKVPFQSGLFISLFLTHSINILPRMFFQLLGSSDCPNSAFQVAPYSHVVHAYIGKTCVHSY